MLVLVISDRQFDPLRNTAAPAHSTISIPYSAALLIVQRATCTTCIFFAIHIRFCLNHKEADRGEIERFI